MQAMNTSTDSSRLTRTFVQRIEASPDEVFPLLCPVREREWLPGWDCRMIYSQSGVAECGAVFETVHPNGSTVWVISDHVPSRRVGFARWQPDGLLVQIEITLGRHLQGDTAVCIAYTYTAVNDHGRAALKLLAEADWLRTMEFWEQSMNTWLRKQRAAA
jgi:hypothetical protein